MEKCVWVRHELVAQIEFLDWTEGNHLRHSQFVGLTYSRIVGKPEVIRRTTNSRALHVIVSALSIRRRVGGRSFQLESLL
jgi:ATP-dependent DNA ligase